MWFATSGIGAGVALVSGVAEIVLRRRLQRMAPNGAVR